MKRLLLLLTLLGALAACAETASAGGHYNWGTRRYYGPGPYVSYGYNPPVVRSYRPTVVIPYGAYTPDYPSYYYGPWATPYGHYSYGPGGVGGLGY